MLRKNPALTVDIIIEYEDGSIVLIKRKNPPFKGKWALPGGFVEYGEKVEEAAKREAKEETGLQIEITKLLGVYSDPKRDPRGHTVSVVFRAKPVKGELKADTDAQEVKKFKKVNYKDLAFDHSEILKDWRKDFLNYEIKVSENFSAAHKLTGYKGKCQRLHGHNFTVEICAAGEKLNKIGLLFDFKKLKEKLNFVLRKLDHQYLNEISPFNKINPTSENLAKFICQELKKILPKNVLLKWVKVAESPKDSLTYFVPT